MTVWVWLGRWLRRNSGGFVKLIMMLKRLVGRWHPLMIGETHLLSVPFQKGRVNGLLKRC
jgi:hypothetical protein